MPFDVGAAMTSYQDMTIKDLMNVSIKSECFELNFIVRQLDNWSDK